MLIKFSNKSFIKKGAQGELGIKGERGDPGLPVNYFIKKKKKQKNKNQIYKILGNRWNTWTRRTTW